MIAVAQVVDYVVIVLQLSGRSRDLCGSSAPYLSVADGSRRCPYLFCDRR